MPFLRVALSLLGAVVATLLTAAPAFADTTLESSDPADGGSLSSAPTQVTLTFADVVNLPSDPIGVTGPDGSAWTVGPATVAGAVVTAPVEAIGPAGQYTLRYEVIADDGARVEGAVRFTLTAAATANTVAAPTTGAAAVAASTVTAAPTVVAAPVDAAGSSGNSGWVWVAVAVVVIGLLAAVVLARTRRRSGRDVR
jgi:copper resistance protein C